jgi:hypothetical protein
MVAVGVVCKAAASSVRMGVCPLSVCSFLTIVQAPTNQKSLINLSDRAMPEYESKEIALPATTTGFENVPQQNSTQELTRRRPYKQDKRDECGSEPEPEPEPEPESEPKDEQAMEILDLHRRLTWEEIRNEWRKIGVDLRQNLWEMRVDLNEAVNALPEET